MSPIMKTLLGSVGSCLILAAAPATAAPAPALAGQVSSAAEGQMEGVLVSAKKDGTPITVTVVTNEKGAYSFPADRLSPGHYTLSIRAVGYDLDPAVTSADVAKGKTAKADLKLDPTKNLEAQITNNEWMKSFPLPDNQKEFLNDCASCHRLDRPANSKFTADQWPDMIKLMASMSAESTPEHPQPLLPGPRDRAPSPQVLAAASKVLASINLSSGPRSYPIKTNPRPTGKATHVIITEYDLPSKDYWPHDVMLDKKGTVWADDFGGEAVGYMDAKTGKFTQVPLPTLKADGSPLGNLDLELDPKGNVWVAMMYQGGLAKIDPTSKKVTTYKLPDSMQNASTQQSFVSPEHSDVDGYVWTNNQDTHSLVKLNLKTGQYEDGGPEKTADGTLVSAYQIAADSHNDVYLFNQGGTLVGLDDKKTGLVTAFATPTAHARPRRGVVDSKDRAWFSEYGANAIGMLDPKTKKISEWKLPTSGSYPYGIDYSDKFNEAWAGSMFTDMVDRLDVKSGVFTEYLLPRSTNIRRVFIDNRGKRPVLWVGNNHGAEIIKVEPQD